MASLKHLLVSILATTLGLTGGLAGFVPEAAHSADKFTFRVTGPLVFTLSVDSLETFAETGEATGNFKLLARFLNEQALAGLRPMLQRRFPLDVVTVSNLSYSPLGRDAITNVGKIVQSTPGENGFYAVRAAVINAAAKAGPEGWTLIDVMREFPADAIDISVSGLLALQRELAIYLDYNQAAVQAIRDQAAAEAAAQSNLNLALPDLSEPGPYAFEETTITVTNPALRQTDQGLTVNYDFDVDVYLPQGTEAPAPIVIVSHGFGAVKEDFVFLNQHLASHGYVVLAPDHVGSDLRYRQAFLGGRLHTLLSPIEFINRPQEISFLIDELERLVARSPDWAARLDLSQIAAIGDSLGSSTVMALAGARLSQARLSEVCNSDVFTLNFARYLECRARYLPPKTYDLSDPRIKAAIAAHNMGSALYGPEGIGQIDVPLLMVTGSADITSPVVTEQFAPFIWLNAEPRYLALLQKGTHFSSKPPGEGAGDVPSFLMGEHRDVGARYYRGMVTAFLGAHLRGQAQYLPYLTAAYAKAISEGQPMIVDMITDLTEAQVNAAYPGTTPVALVPPPATPVPPRDESVLAAIARTGELRIAMRRDAPPFGYVDDTAGWTGYCPSLAEALRGYLQDEIDRAVEVSVVALPSTLSDRYDLVRDGQVYLECGPNTVRTDVEGIEFSDLIFATGSHLLTTPDQVEAVNPALSLAGVNVGVLANSTNESFLQERYPAATITRFEGPTGRADAIAAVTSGQINAFLGDDILTLAEVAQEGLSTESLALVPELPLTCEYYSLVLPSDDPQWVATVNSFLKANAGSDTWQAWLGKFAADSLKTLNYCLNR
ncbi:dienelactone hydrolase [filamentous cyanobacterium CCP3]|nr:dienelactone hydrolase [filamentous cyanobacterium CCP3]